MTYSPTQKDTIMPTFNVTATPVTSERHDGYSTIRFELFANANERGTITVSSPGDVALSLSEWANSLTLPATDRNGTPSNTNAWAVSITKPARWPSGYKQAGEHTYTFVVGRPLFEVVAAGTISV